MHPPSLFFIDNIAGHYFEQFAILAFGLVLNQERLNSFSTSVRQMYIQTYAFVAPQVIKRISLLFS